VLFFLTDASSPWAVEAPPAATLAPVILRGGRHLVSYHVVTEGRCWCEVPGSDSGWLHAGDVIVIPHGDPYLLASAPGLHSDMSQEAALEFFRMVAGGELPFAMTQGAGGPDRTRILCGFLGSDTLPFNPVLAALPRLVRVHRDRTALDDRVGLLVELAMAEARERRPGSECVLLRLSELLFVEVLRRYVVTLGTDQTGWLAGLRDPTVARALSVLHARPADHWTIEALARAANTSRTVLAERFTRFVGQPPIQYLVHWRMQLAARLLADKSAKVSAVALDVGYDSEAAFSRAFKRSVGLSPAAWRNIHAGGRSREALAEEGGLHAPPARPLARQPRSPFPE
jgi:AraC-like DNA-binding protein